jgi:vacuolar protein sorting-associated protein VTA1
MQSQPSQHFVQPIQPAAQTLSQGPFNTDDQSVLYAEKHAKWAISALQFEDVNTAVKELREALRALGAN